MRWCTFSCLRHSPHSPCTNAAPGRCSAELLVSVSAVHRSPGPHTTWSRHLVTLHVLAFLPGLLQGGFARPSATYTGHRLVVYSPKQKDCPATHSGITLLLCVPTAGRKQGRPPCVQQPLASSRAARMLPCSSPLTTRCQRRRGLQMCTPAR
jgi:hypothetical protein